MADADRAPDDGWLVLIYRVPSEPSRLRSAVWRRLKSLGAIYLQNSAAALPASVGNERALRKLRSQILDMEGTAALLSCRVLAGEQEVRASFQAARNDEYEEIVDRCEDFLGQVKKEYVGQPLHLRRARGERGRPGQAAHLVRAGARPGRVRRDRPPRGGRRRSKSASSRSMTMRRACMPRKKTATDRPGRYLLATIHLLSHTPARLAYGRVGARLYLPAGPSCIPPDPPLFNPTILTFVRT